jgi:hypothetical protein
MDLTKLSKSKLLTMCNELNIETTKLKKEDLIQLIKNNEL